MNDIFTSRLSLRTFAPADAGDVFAYASNPNVSRYTTWATHRTIADAAAYLRRIVGRPPGNYCWAVRLTGQETVIGAIELGPCGSARAEIHYVLAEPHWNHGLMTEAAAAVLEWGFENHPNVTRVTTAIIAANIGSRRVAEKIGMKFQRIESEIWAKFDQPVEVVIYEIKKSEPGRAGPMTAGATDPGFI